MVNTFSEEPTNVILTLLGKHRCELHSADRSYGTALKYCYEDADDKLWVGNIEYESQVNYCPVCGFKTVIKSILLI